MTCKLINEKKGHLSKGWFKALQILNMVFINTFDIYFNSYNYLIISLNANLKKGKKWNIPRELEIKILIEFKNFYIKIVTLLLPGLSELSGMQ